MAAPQLAALQPTAFQLSLRIKHPSMDPADISQELGIEPEHSFRAGQPRQSKSGLASAAVHTESYWLAPLNPSSWSVNPPFEPLPDLPISPGAIETAVARNLAWALGLCAMRLHKAQALLQTIHSEGGEISLLVTISPTATNNFSLQPQASRLFGEMGIALEFEITDD